MGQLPGYPQVQQFNQPLTSTAPNPYTNPRPNPYRIQGTPQYAAMHPLEAAPGLSSAPRFNAAPSFDQGQINLARRSAMTGIPGLSPNLSGPASGLRDFNSRGGLAAIAGSAPGRVDQMPITGSGGSVQQLYGGNGTYAPSVAAGQNQIDAGNKIAAGPLPTINSVGQGQPGNFMTEPIARSYWKSISGNPVLQGDRFKDERERQFTEEMAKHGFNGPALLDHWSKTDGNGGMPQTDFVNGFKNTPAVPGMLISMLGPDRAGGMPPPGMFAASGGVNGPRIGGSPAMSTPIMGPMGGMAPISRDYMLPTREAIAADKNGDYLSQVPTGTKYPNVLGIRDAAAQPVDDATRANVLTSEANRLRNAGQDQINNSVPGPREVFNANNANIQAALNQPVAVADARAGGQVGAAQARGAATTQAAQTNADGRTGSAKINAQSRQTVAEIQAAAKQASSQGKTLPTSGARAPTPANIEGVFNHTADIRVPNDKFDPSQDVDWNKGVNLPTRALTLDERKSQAYGFFGMTPPTTQPSAPTGDKSVTAPTAARLLDQNGGNLGAAEAQGNSEGYPTVPEGGKMNPDGTLSVGGQRYVRDEKRKGWRKAG